MEEYCKKIKFYDENNTIVVLLGLVTEEPDFINVTTRRGQYKINKKQVFSINTTPIIYTDGKDENEEPS